MEVIETTLSKIVFFNEESNYAIFKGDGGCSIKGSIIDMPEHLIGIKVALSGDFSSTAKYGREFNFSDYKIIEGELFFFLTKIAKGIKRATALEISNKYGDRFEDVILNKPNELLGIKGIGRKKLNDLIVSWDESKDLKKLSGKLSPFGITANMIVKIYRHYGAQSNAIIDSNPYRLVEIKGIGFKKADEVARKIGIAQNDKRRADACLLFCLSEYMIGSGHTIIWDEELLSVFIKESLVEDMDGAMDSSLYESAKRRWIDMGKIIEVETGVYSLKAVFEAEMSAVSILKDASSRKGESILSDAEGYIEKYEKECSLLFGEKQKEAILMAAKNKKVFAVTGYAGTGKSSVSKAILGMYSDRFGYESIVCCALSGIAATRVKKQSGFKGSTIHTLLGFDQTTGGFLYSEKNKLPYAVVLLDEASMVDVITFNSLLKAIDFNSTNLIVMGDPAQLPPVGPGEIFSDIISFGLIEAITLDKIYRQSEDKMITTFAQDVRNGVVPETGIEYEDFKFVDISISGYWEKKKTLPQKQISDLIEENNRKIVDYIIHEAIGALPFIKESYQRDAWEGLTRFQVIVPMKNGTVGVKNLNIVLQEIINPPSQTGNTLLSLGSGREFRTKDKVIHLQNKKMTCITAEGFKAAMNAGEEPSTFETKVFNGQVGVLFKGDKEEDEHLVYYPNEGIVVIYSKADFVSGIIDLAYALTGHKTQGSEFHEVILPVANAHWMMLNNKLLYTEMTRAKEKLTIVGEKYAFSSGCKKSDSTARNTIAKLMFKPKQEKKDDECSWEEMFK